MQSILSCPVLSCPVLTSSTRQSGSDHINRPLTISCVSLRQSPFIQSIDGGRFHKIALSQATPLPPTHIWIDPYTPSSNTCWPIASLSHTTDCTGSKNHTLLCDFHFSYIYFHFILYYFILLRLISYPNQSGSNQNSLPYFLLPLYTRNQNMICVSVHEIRKWNHGREREGVPSSQVKYLIYKYFDDLWHSSP